MPGMGGSVSSDNPVVVAAFHAALRHQALVVLLLLAVALFARLVLVALRPARQSGSTLAQPGVAEHPGRRLLRISFGILWVADGLLQTQQAMPLGMPSQVVAPAAAGSPAWVVDLVRFGTDIWNRHPIPAATSVVWIQIGIGALLLLAPRGRLSRLAGLLSVGWALVVWVFGEAFGSIFAPGLTWLFGAPGAVVFYGVAGALIALPDRAWGGRRLGRSLLSGIGLLLVGMAVLQAWPGRGYWRGHAGGITTMVQAMARTPQPAWLSSLLSSFASFDAAHGWVVNFFVVVSLAAIGGAFLSGRRRLVVAAVVYATVFSLATWVLVQDLGFLGGLGTDPNTMIPFLLLVFAGELALTREAALVTAPAPAPAAAGQAPAAPPAGRGLAAPVALGMVTTIAVLAVLLVGAVPMALASVNPRTDPVVTEALNGQPEPSDSPAPGFRLTDQFGATVSLASLRGRTVVLTFLDPVCTSDCPLIAQELRQVDTSLHDPAGTAFVAVVANPVYRAQEFTRAFDAQEHLTDLPNWYYLTGSVAQLRAVWQSYGLQVETVAGGAMVAHADLAYIIGPTGMMREALSDDPGDDSTSSASLATLIDDEVRSVMRS